MFTRTKCFGIALIALAALGAADAGAASARIVHDFKADKSPVIITGEQVSALPIEYKFGESTLICLTHKANGTISMPNSQLTLEFAGSNCTLNGKTATLNASNCRYVLTGETTNEHSNLFFECFGGGKIKVEVTGCTLEIGEQTIGSAVAYKKTADGNGVQDVDAVFTGAGGTYTKTGLLCSGIGGTGKDLGVFGTYTLKAYEDNFGKEGSQVNFTYETTILP